ncbi:KedN5 family methylcobalamin-dependent radical SAM C-methyltransferase [Saccharomonospora xinjiangensis]|uniref:KedN5 family methylcobalamin-dependent radical SAM C-methyltransferase n=1 Tax=Saccharomonospora xinjiangensis TaxID=75294 RepID=UPI00106F7E5C|nr:KedN5 family methylcobalamin-dependent radical SAM C-methyltransferase [Saccharomonospora xinjiangensis]QBQ60544.1 Ribosomal protein S12 methylthiotransferase RimO [Saccharomonospora xinjiangensis]
MVDPPLKVWLVQQGVWAMSLESMPLASGYLKATALEDDRIAANADIRIRNFDGGSTLFGMANDLFHDGAPDVMAFSVLGWNYREFAALAETFKEINPDGWAIFGGNHVSQQADRVFALHPYVDVVVNGEGEFTFRDLLLARLDERSPRELHDIDGISFHDGDARVVTTKDRPRIDNLDEVASPFLTGAIPLTDEHGRFPYDVALLETNRGCPYKCSFCYWGGAVGQRVRAFSRERLRQEIELFAQHKVHTLVLCDANFGMMPIDLEFVEDVIATRERYGYPRSIETSWAKNKSAVFFKIVKAMKDAGLHSSFTLALQTLDEGTLDLMNRRNMKVNDWESLAEWLGKEGLDCYAELIWGAPGETIDSFMKGYDRLANHVSRVAVYPMLILPNTTYHTERERFGLVTVRGNTDDFEYLLSHDTMSPRDNQYMHRFIFVARLIAENPVLRYTWAPLRTLGGITQSELIRSLMDWFEHDTDPSAEPFRTGMINSFTDSDVLAPVLTRVYGTDEAKDMLRRWWTSSVLPRVPDEVRPVLDTIFEYDLLTLPAYTQPGHDPSSRHANETLPIVDIDGESYHVWRDVWTGFDVPALTMALRRDEPYEHLLTPTVHSLYYKVGADRFLPSTNHEEIVYYMGKLDRQLLGRP